MFTNADGSCNSLARSAVRLGFHDAAAWSKTSGPGDADGSLVLRPDEINRPENNGMQAIRQKAVGLLAIYGIWGVGGADLVQFMQNVATVVCPLGPRILTFVGRPNRFTSDPKGLIPDTHSSAEQLIELFANKTINFKDLIALIGAHTTAQQFFVDPSKAGQPLDSTPGVWDVEFYRQALTPTPPP
jgi:catalase (peroxidase I)